MLDLNVDFLNADPEYWQLRKDFQEALEKVQAPNVHVERGMALTEEFCSHFTQGRVSATLYAANC